MAMVFYVSSKVKYASIWRDLRERGISINSTWIDQIGPTDDIDLVMLSKQCIKEASEADALLLYTEHDDLLKGALLECGASLAAGHPVICIGSGKSISHVFTRHPLWFSAANIDDAVALANGIYEENHSDQDALQVSEGA